jgi:predicted HAD superfamily phosphohydrolase
MSKPASLNYGIPFPEEEKKRIIVNLYESGIGEEFIAMQLDKLFFVYSDVSFEKISFFTILSSLALI